MPEYSSTTITPADGVQLPAQNGGTSGNFQLSALRSFILASKGQANGLAGLGPDGKLDPSQVPDSLDDVLVYATRSNFPAAGTAGKIYIAADTNRPYRWDDALATPAYVELSVDLSAYATKAEMEAADTDLKNAISQLDHRLENIEQAKGSYVVQNYKDGSITPSGKGNWAVVEGLRGVSRVENQLAKLSADGWSYNSGLTTLSFDVSNRKTKFKSASSGTYPAINNYNIIQGHSYLVAFNATAVPSAFYVQNGSATDFSREVNSTGYREYVITADSTFIGFKSGNATLVDIELTDLIITDLNIYFNTSDLSFLGATDSAKLATIQTNYPHLLLPSDYGVRIVDSSYSGVNSIGFNRFDKTKITENKIIDHDGTILNGSGYAYSDFMRIKPETTYYIKSTAIVNYYQVHYYDVNKNWIGRAVGSASNTTFISMAGSCYARINVQMNDIDNVNFNLSDNSLNGQTFPYMENTLSLTFTGKSAGAVAEMYYPETGEQTKPLGSYIFTGEEPISAWGSSYPNLFKVTVTNNAKRNNTTNFLSTRYMPYGALSGDRYTQNCIYTTSDNAFVINDIECTTVEQFRAKIANVPLYYELKEADPSTFVTPIIDNTLLTESGGRMATVQTGTVVDGSFDMGFITL